MAEEEREKSLWMRYVDFRRVRDLLSIIKENNGSLRAGELEQVAIENEVLVRDDGRPLAHSPRYHYRRVIEHLGLATKVDYKYFISEDEEITKVLSQARSKNPLSREEGEVFAHFVISNPDCRRNYFDYFIDEDSYTLEGFRRKAGWVKVETKGETGINFLNREGRVVAVLRDEVQLQAVFWGVRLWSLELGITDELFTHYADGRIIYAIGGCTSLAQDRLLGHIETLAKRMPGQDWVTISLPELIKEIALSDHVPVDQVKISVEELKRHSPALIELVVSSSAFIDLKTPFASQDKVLFKSYLQDKSGRFISHIKLHNDIFRRQFRKPGGNHASRSTRE